MMRSPRLIPPKVNKEWLAYELAAEGGHFGLHPLSSELEARGDGAEVPQWHQLLDDLEFSLETHHQGRVNSRAAEERILETAVRALKEVGEELPPLIYTDEGIAAVQIQLIADCVNLAAKMYDERFYDLKERILTAAARRGILYWSDDDSTFVISTPEGGTSHYHDPMGQTAELIRQSRHSVQEWEHGWSGFFRQHAAFELARAPELLRVMADLTAPGRELSEVELILAESLGIERAQW